jgi:hypothetical protein
MKHQLLLQRLDLLRKRPQNGQTLEDLTGWEDLNDPIDQSMDIYPEADIREALDVPCTTEPEHQGTKLLTNKSLQLHTTWAGVLPDLMSPLLPSVRLFNGMTAFMSTWRMSLILQLKLPTT